MMTTTDSMATPSTVMEADPAPDTEAFARFLGAVAQHRSSEWAWQEYKSTIQNLIVLLNARTILEIGGGRWPLLADDEKNTGEIRYIVNEFSPSELALSPIFV